MKSVSFNESDIKKILRVDNRAKKVWRVTTRTLRQLVYLGTLFVVFFLVLNYAAFWKRFQFSVTATPPAKIVVIQPVKTAPLPDYPPSITIPKLSLEAPITLNVSAADMLAQLKHGATQYLGTALPGQIGNMVLVGHSSDFPWSDGEYKTLFALIDKLAPGDQIIVPYQTQKFVYQVTTTKIVKPTDLSVLQKTDSPTLTLLTCYPVGTTRSRLIVIATLVSGNATGPQLTEPAISAVPTPR